MAQQFWPAHESRLRQYSHWQGRLVVWLGATRHGRGGALKILRRRAVAFCAVLVVATAVFLVSRPAVESEQRWQALRARGVLRVGIDPGIRPFSFYGADGWEGMDADVAHEAARRLGLRVEAVPVGYDGFYDALLAGYADVAMSALVVDPMRTADFRYSRPYFDAGLRAVTFAALRLDRPEDLRGRCVVAALGSEADRLARWLERRTPGMTRRVAADEKEVLTEIRMGRCEVAVVSGQIAVREGCAPIDEWDNTAAIRCLRLRPVEHTIAMLGADGRLASELNRILLQMSNDGTLTRIARKWLTNRTADTADTDANDTNDTNR
ncbi:MAG: hypothetical protein CUN48_01950 [Candidatus Thermofonsia Clade 3 bacterium]|uniref:Solute-binding protein family 3/N-terminal domain-containing protein n=1 Tax=Candidatus Thermofonsia Clade 3 bacterium TaxID=2364212 RepID=A0A2M8QFZ0_9CHLR|nr:MAG: hypothetical protein CUN48_01950 [Candidatus Thermofonsia Clade 3 bacterium]